MRMYRQAAVAALLAAVLIPVGLDAAERDDDTLPEFWPGTSPKGMPTAKEARYYASLDKTFAAFSKYAPGASRKVVKAAEAAVYRASGHPHARAAVAARLVAVLKDKAATAEAKCLACLYVPLVCDGGATGPLVALLGDPATAGAARGALERLGDPGAGMPLRAALRGARGPMRIGIINSIGARRDAKATGALKGLLGDKDAATAAAAAAALGAIGTTDAAEALTGGNQKPTLALLDALLECAERRLDAADGTSAASLYRRFTAKGRPDRWRWAGLTGLAKCSPDEALPQLLAVLDDKDGALGGRALSLIAAMPGAKVTAAMTARLARLDAGGRARLLAALGRRGDRSAAGAVAKSLASSDPQVQVAAIEAIGHLGDHSSIAVLARIAAAGKVPARSAARASLVRLPGSKVDSALLAGIAKGPADVRVELIAAAIGRRAKGVVAALLSAAGDPEPTVRAAAYGGLAGLAGRAELPRLVRMLAAAKTTADRAGIEQALLSVARRIQDPPAAAGGVLAALKSSDGETSAALLRVASILGGGEALGAVVARLGASDATVREAALRCLTNWADPAACEPLLKIVTDSPDRRSRILAMRGYLRLAPAAKDPTAAFGRIRQLVKTVESKRMMLSAIGSAPASTATLGMAVSMLDDSQVKGEAVLAVLAVAGQIARQSPGAVAEAFAKVRAGRPGAEVITKMAAIERQARRPRARGQARVAYGPKEIEARKKQLASRGAKGCRMVLYLDCGPARAAGKAPGPQIKQLTGTSWVWGGAGKVPAGTVAFDSAEVAFALNGLDAKKQYALGFSWWDYDHNDRAESVWASASSGRRVQLLKATRLPSYSAGRKPAAEINVAIPQALSSKGEVRVTFRREGGANAVVGEIWLWEADSGTEIKFAGVPATAPVPAAAPPRRRKGLAKPRAAAGAELPVVMTAPKDESKTNVLIVTGVDYPGHKWKLTTPVLTRILAKDKRFEVRVVADPHQLASPLLHKYDVVVLHFMDHRVPSPGPEARANFKKFVQAGGGLVIVHFACGAWQDWSEYVKIGGRVWNPKFRGHDPRGQFTVDMTKVDHPITKGMKSFKTTDELYTCLDGKTPMTVLAEARSKVDKKLYPMGFVLQYGKGRVFNSPLGHDVKAFQAAGVGELFRRGTAWAAKLVPVVPKQRAAR